MLPVGVAERGTQLSGNVARDLLLQRDEVGTLAGIAVAPDFGVVSNIGELCADVNGVPLQQHSPADHDRDAKIAADGSHLNILAFVAKDRVAGPELQLGYMGEVADQGLSNAVAEIVRAGVATDVGEGE